VSIEVIIESDEKKGWIDGHIPPHVFNALSELPGRKRYVQGKPFIELSRSNLEFLDTRLNVQWRGPAANLVEEFKKMREVEKATRDARFLTPTDFGFPYKHQPYEHQLQCNVLARGKVAFGYFMEQGTGKTKALLDDAADIFLNGGDNGKIDTLIIIAPNGVHAQWVNEQVPEHLSPSVPWAGGYTVANPTPAEALRLSKAKLFRQGLRIIAIHIDMLSHKSGEEMLQELLLSSKAMLVVDESSRIKDGTSKRTQNLLNLGKLAKYRRILTGTPISQGVEDLYTQFFFLDKNILGYDSFYAFRNHFCRLQQIEVGKPDAKGKKRRFSKIVGYINEDELKRKIDSYSFRVLKSECLDLPEKNFIRQEVLLTPEQKELYAKMKKEFFVDLEAGLLTARMAVTRLIRLQQIISGFVWKHPKKDPETGRIIEPEVYQEFPTNRVDRAIDIIQEAQGKVIVWVKFQGDWRILTKALNAAKIGWVDYVGTTPQQDRQGNIDRFRNDPNVKVFISSPKSGGTGLNLTVASEVIWFSRDFSLEAELQANDRCHRIGQHNVVNYHYLIAPKTVDDRIDAVLKAKKSIAENIIDIRDLFADDE
jgi:hypothetical protein